MIYHFHLNKLTSKKDFNGDKGTVLLSLIESTYETEVPSHRVL